MFGEKRVEKKKTPVYKCNLNPIFNATFEFDVPWEQIRDCALDVQVNSLQHLNYLKLSHDCNPTKYCDTNILTDSCFLKSGYGL